MWHMGSLLHPVGSFTAVHGFSSCGSRAPEAVGSVIAAHRLRGSAGTWDLSSLTRDRTYLSCTARQILKHWAMGSPLSLILVSLSVLFSWGHPCWNFLTSCANLGRSVGPHEGHWITGSAGNPSGPVQGAVSLFLCCRGPGLEAVDLP